MEFIEGLFRSKTKLTVACEAVNETNPRGESIPVRVEIFNHTDTEVELRTAGVPWESFYAIEFEVKNKPGFRKFYKEGMPLSLPPTRIPAGGSIVGEVSLEEYAGGPNANEHINKMPGDYIVEALVKTFVIKERGDDEILRLRSNAFNVRVV